MPWQDDKQMHIADAGAASKEDQEIHQKAVLALAHYYKHRDCMPLTRMVLKLPNSNRRVAMLEWIRKFTVLHWDRTRNVLVRKKLPELQDLLGATALPFWTFKIKQEQRRHVSGNTFDPDHFFDRVIADIQANLDRLSAAKLELTAVKLLKIAAEKRAKSEVNDKQAL